MSCGKASENGLYNEYSRAIDEYILRYKVTICIAAGNPSEAGTHIQNRYVNQFGLAPNAVTVGAVVSTGTNPASEIAFEPADYSLYREDITVVNKPDICAPGNISIYTHEDSGTSFSTAFITGTVVQMMARNIGLSDKPETIKAALMASASYNAYTDMTYVDGTIASNREGAGIVDAEFCYYVAQNGRRTYIDVVNNEETQTINVYCDHTDRPFRIAATWYDSIVGTYVDVTDFNLKVYKNGLLVADSMAMSGSTVKPNTNYEIISIPEEILQQYGAGYYTVEVSMLGINKGPEGNRIGFAWEQIR